MRTELFDHSLSAIYEPFLGRLRRPEYTGVNRCWPCTAVNLGIAAGIVGVTGWIWPPAAVGFSLFAVLLITMRGYLVPGTPALTKRYLPVPMHRLFGADGPRTDSTGLDVEAALRSFGAIVNAREVDDVELAPAFEAAWSAQIASISAGGLEAEQLADMIGVDANRLEIDWYGEAFTAWLDGRWVGQWESRAAFVADVAGAAVIASRFDGWHALALSHRSQLLGTLRLFLNRCPTCRGKIELGQDVVESCCRSLDVVAATCRDCGARVFETPLKPEFLESAVVDSERIGPSRGFRDAVSQSLPREPQSETP